VIFGKYRNTLGYKSDTISIYAPISGKLIPITEVSDPTFSEELLGKGVAIRPSSGQVVSPVHGTVTHLFQTGHAVTLTSQCGTEVLIHIGLDTVRLKGIHFNPHVQQGTIVKPGDLLIKFDPIAITFKGFDIVTPIVICNSDEYDDFSFPEEKFVHEGDEIISFIKK